MHISMAATLLLLHIRNSFASESGADSQETCLSLVDSGFFSCSSPENIDLRKTTLYVCARMCACAGVHV